MKINKINLFTKSYNKKTTRITEVFRHYIKDRTVIANGNFEKHICTVEMLIDPNLTRAAFYLIEHVMGTSIVKFTGSASLKKGDTYNRLMGKDIAEHKALAKLFNYELKVLKELRSIMNNNKSDIIVRYIRKVMDKRDKQLNCIKKMVE